MRFIVRNASAIVLLSSASYLDARRRWGAYLSSSPAPSEVSGIEVAENGVRLDVEMLDRWTGYGSPEEREPTEDEVLACTW